jgi:hypothetical protein
MALADRLPKHLPEVIAVRADWNAWLAEEVKGKDLFSSPDSDSWCCAAKSLAYLQIDSIEHTWRILGSVAREARSARLLDMVVPFFSTIESVMEAQIKPAPRKLTAQEIKTVERRVTDALIQMERSGVPDTLNHFDLNPGNVIVHAGNCKFLDWAEGAVGNPFFSMEYLRQHFMQTFCGQEDVAIEFRKSYSNAWRSLLPDSTVERMFELVPLTAAFAFAATVLPWEDPYVNAKPEIAGFLRSLARRMHREYEQLSCSAA